MAFLKQGLQIKRVLGESREKELSLNHKNRNNLECGSEDRIKLIVFKSFYQNVKSFFLKPSQRVFNFLALKAVKFLYKCTNILLLVIN